MDRINNSSSAWPGLVIGARGWEHEGWNGLFYPADLPPEWRLAYYANEFRAVLVPPEVWARCTRAQLVQWRADVRGDFRFFVELACDPACMEGFAQTCAQLSDKLNALDDLVGGLVLRLARPAVGQVLREMLQRLPSRYRVSLVLAGGALSEEALHAVAESGAGLCWPAGQSAGSGELGLVRVEDGKYTLRGLRRELEAFLEQARGSEHAFLFIDGDPPGLQAMRDAVVIKGLLGA